MLRVDLERREVVASVRDLAYPPSQVPRASGTAGAFRAELGSVVHRAYRASSEARDDGFQGEVTLSWEHVVDGFRVRLSGRTDGLIEEADDRFRIEEVKSTLRSGAELAGLELADVEREALLQARLYALILARTWPDVHVDVTLVMVSVVERAERTLAVPFDPEATERVLDNAIRRLVGAARMRADGVAKRARSAALLRFPFDGYRPQQEELVTSIAEGLAAERPVLAEAPTGIGKTISALLPGLQFALPRDALLFYLTAKRTQRHHVAETFEQLVQTAGVRRGTLRAMTLRPRNAMCPTGTLLCHVDHCPLLAKLLRPEPRREVIDTLLADTVHVTPDAVYAAGDRNGLCPHALAQMIAPRMDLLIGDYNHVYLPTAPPGTFPGEPIPRPVVAVVDEAHNLYDRAREYDSVFLPRDLVVTLTEQWPVLPEPDGFLFAALVEPARPDVHRGVARALHDLLELIDRTIREAVESEPASTDGGRLAVPDQEAWGALADRCAWLVVQYLEERGPVAGPLEADPIVEVLGHVVRVRDLLRREEPGLVPYASCGTVGKLDPGVGILCVDPAPRLRNRHRQMLGTIAMSATLSPSEHYRRGLGFAELSPLEVGLPSPFPAENRLVRVVPSVATTWRARARNYGRIARLVEQVIGARPGHYAAYFPSFRFLEAVREQLTVVPRTLLVQTPRMPDGERRAVLERLRDDPEPVLLLAVAGGVLAEGVDLPGDALIGVIVAGPSLPPIGFERDAMCRYHDEQGEEGFARAMLYPGMQRVVQAAGRVHRSATDRGVIVLLGSRFAQPQYAECLPSSWSRYGVEELVVGDLRNELETFWSDEARAGGADPCPS